MLGRYDYESRPRFRKRFVCSRQMKLHRQKKQLGGSVASQPRTRSARVGAQSVALSAEADEDLGLEPMDEDDVGATAAAALDSRPSTPASASGSLHNSAADDQGLGSQEALKPKRHVTLLPSVFEGRPPVVLFSYTVACGAKQRPLDRAVPTPDDAPRMFYCHTDKVHEYNAVINILRHGGLYRIRQESQRWVLLWSIHPPPEVLRALTKVQKTNHFPGSCHMGRKDLMWKNLHKMQRRFGQPYNIMPRGFVLPKNLAAWDIARSQRPDTLWIWKPCRQSCGRGIRVLNGAMPQEEAKELARKRGIVHKYVHNPLLIDGYKFDLRVYVVVISYDPLKIYINEEGLVRLATEKYSASVDTLESRTMHLTNYSVNKMSPAFVQNTDGRDGGAAKLSEEGENPEEDEPRAFKLTFAELRANLEARGLDYDAMWSRTKDLVIKTLIAVEAPLSAEWSRGLDQEEEGWAAMGPGGANRSSCFEIYGFDVLVDSVMKPWLLEVNICPSLSSGSPMDKRIKTKLVADTLTLVGLRPPACLWGRTNSTGKRLSDEEADEAAASAKEALTLSQYSKEALEARAARLLACESAGEAVALFEQPEWDAVMDAYEEDMRSGGLVRIFPAENAGQYTMYFSSESYCNLVLRLWHEAGGAEYFGRGDLAHRRPTWLPEQISFSRT